MCSIESVSAHELKYSVMALFVLVERGQLKPSSVLEGLCEHHSYQLAHKVFHTKSMKRARGADVIPLPTKETRGG